VLVCVVCKGCVRCRARVGGRRQGRSCKSGSGSRKPPNSITLEFGKLGDAKLGLKRTKKPDSSSSQVSLAPNGSSGVATWGSVSVPAGFLKPPFTPGLKGPGVISSSVVIGRAVSRVLSPLSRRSSPPRSTAPTPTGAGLVIPRTVIERRVKQRTSSSSTVGIGIWVCCHENGA
jgi:hypothetical protein